MLSASSVLSACTSAPIKVYVIKQDGLNRKQANEVIKFQDADGYLCTSPTDFRTLAEILKQCGR